MEKQKKELLIFNCLERTLQINPNYILENETIKSRPYDYNVMLLQIILNHMQMNLTDILRMAIDTPIQGESYDDNLNRREALVDYIFEEFKQRACREMEEIPFEDLRIAYSRCNNVLVEDTENLSFKIIVRKIKSAIKHIVRQANNKVTCMRHTNEDITFGKLASRRWDKKVFDEKSGKLMYVMGNENSTVEEALNPEKIEEDLKEMPNINLVKKRSYKNAKLRLRTNSKKI